MTERLDGARAADIARAAKLLRAGALVAFPTETVYGLGADGLDEGATRSVFEAKGRPADNPLILHVASFEDAEALWSADARGLHRARALAHAFWPGPLTMVLPATAGVPSTVRAGLDTVAVRVPDHLLALALIEAVGRPLAAPSANASGRPSPTSAEHVLRTLDGRVAAVLDGGPTRVGVESTVVELGGEQPALLRTGSIGADEIAAVLGEALTPLTAGEDEGGAARAPGMRHRHYAPQGVRASLVDDETLARCWSQDAAVLCRQAAGSSLGGRAAVTEMLPDDARGFARALYAALYRIELSGADRLLVQTPPDDAAWDAVRDRLRRAVGEL